MKFALVLIAVGAVISVGKGSQLLKKFAVRNNRFTANVYKELLKSKSDNIVVSPISAEIVLALVHVGAEGQTAQQLSAGLQLPDNPGKILQIFKELAPHLEGNENYTLSSANKIYVKSGYKVKEQFKNTAVNVFNADIENIDFAKSEEAASEINKWVENKTHDKIKNLISKDKLSDATRAILINAMYFHGTWKYPFDEHATFKQTFHLNKDHHVAVDMMHKLDNFTYYESRKLKAKFLELPYEGNDITMTFVLPNDIEGLSNLESNIKYFLNPLYAPHPSKVYVQIPKFKIETKIDFNSILKALGITRAFQDNAQFMKILENNSLKISEVVQKAFIAVEEKGTTAAAATDVDIVASSAPGRLPKKFIADHPFIFYLKKNGIVLFIGRYTSPEN